MVTKWLCCAAGVLGMTALSALGDERHGSGFDQTHGSPAISGQARRPAVHLGEELDLW